MKVPLPPYALSHRNVQVRILGCNLEPLVDVLHRLFQIIALLMEGREAGSCGDKIGGNFQRTMKTGHGFVELPVRPKA